MSDENVLDPRDLYGPLYNIEVFGDVVDRKKEEFRRLISRGIDRVSATLSPYLKRGRRIKDDLTHRVSYTVTNLPRYIGGTFNRLTHRAEFNANSLDGNKEWARESAAHEIGHAALEFDGVNTAYTSAGRRVWGDMFANRYGERYRGIGGKIGEYTANKIALEGLATVVQEDSDGISSMSAYTREKHAVRSAIGKYGRKRTLSPTDRDAEEILPFMVRAYSEYRSML